jgi:predicted GNAT family N-acyltransferase
LIEIRVAYWPEQRDRQALKAIRYAVFVDEQQVPADEEMDAFDETSVHLLASSNETGFIGCARIMPSGQIGRMAVLKRCRGDGIGSQLMTAAIAEAKRQNLETVFLHAQCHAETFYARFGFVASGDIFDEAGIEHIKMILPS